VNTQNSGNITRKADAKKTRLEQPGCNTCHNGIYMAERMLDQVGARTPMMQVSRIRI
jgi:hypothetical protein